MNGRASGGILAEQQRLANQAQKLKGAREAVMEKLDEYKQHYEEMHVQALAAELEVTTLQLQVEQLTESLTQYEEANKVLSEQLSAQRKLASDKEKTMQRFEKKLGRIRSAIITEVNKLRHNDKDLRLAFDSIMQCVLEFRNKAITKEDFLCAVDLIFSTVVQHSHTSIHSSPRIETVFGESERERLASLSHAARKSRLAQLMSMLGEKDFGASTDEDLLSQDESHTPSPPPVPPRKVSTRQPPKRKSARERKHSKPAGPVEEKASVSLPESRAPEENGIGVYSMATEAEGNGTGVYSVATEAEGNGTGVYSVATEAEGNGTGVYSVATEAEGNGTGVYSVATEAEGNGTGVYSVATEAEGNGTGVYSVATEAEGNGTGVYSVATEAEGNGTGVYSMATAPVSNSDSDSDFEQFTPPLHNKARKRYISEPSQLQARIREHSIRYRSSSLISNAEGLTSSSAVISRMPAWFCNKRTLAAGKRRSRSLDMTRSMAVVRQSIPSIAVTADSDDNTGGSEGYARPFEHLWFWRKMLGIDSSILTGSLPQIDKAVEESDDSNATYLDPSEIIAAVGLKHGRKASRRAMKRVSTVLTSTSNGYYLPLVGTLRRAEDPSQPTPDAVTPHTPYIRMDTAVASAKKWGCTSESGMSGYASDVSSDSLRRESTYARIPEIAQGFDNLMYDSNSGACPLPQKIDGVYASIEELDLSGRTGSQVSGRRKRSLPALPSQPRLRYQPSTNPDLDLQDGYCFLGDGLEAELPTCSLPRPPSLPPRKHFQLPRAPGGYTANQRTSAQTDRNKLKPPGIGPLPLYTTLRGSHSRTQLVPYFSSPAASSDEHTFSDSEKPEHLYSLGKFVSVDPRKGALLQKRLQPMTRGSSSRIARRATCQATHAVASPMVDSEPSSPDGPGGGGEGVGPHRLNGHTPLKQERSHTFTHYTGHEINPHESLPSSTSEKSGYLQKMDPKQRHWTRRWFVLKHSQLKYYRTKESFFGMNRSRGTINLDSWCQLIRLETDTAFQLATPKRTYHLVADSAHDCEDWLRVLQVAMGTVTEQSPLKKKIQTVSGWARMSRKNSRPQKVWCQLEGDALKLSSKPGEKPLHQIGLQHTTVRRRRDSLLLDAMHSHSNLHGATKLSITEEDENTTYLTPESQEDKDSWYYYLNVASAGGEGPELTLTEKLLARILQEGGGRDHSMWKHPVLTCTVPPLRDALTSLPSATLVQKAKKMFQSVQLFMTTPLDPLGLDYHIACLQSLMGTCLSHAHLQDELYCQLLRQLSGHTNPSTPTIMQGWYLLHLLLPIFLPQRRFRWYLQTFLERHTFSHNPTIIEMAKQCQLTMYGAEKAGPRECRPSQFELLRLMLRCSHIPSAIQTCLKLPVYLTNGTSKEIEFHPSTTVHEFVSQLNQTIGMPDVITTGFALMSDWPGEECWACFYLFPESKLCDVIASWMDTLEELNQQQLQGRRRRGIMLTYRNRLVLRRRHGHETEREVALLAYQASREVHSGRHPVSSLDEGAKMAAIMAQIEYGNWSAVVKREEDDSEGVACEALQRFCPSRFTHLTLEHDNSLLKQKLVGYWKELHDMARPRCAHLYLTMARRWNFCGAALFEAQERFSSQKTRSIWLAVTEDGVSLLEHSSKEPIASYSYSEVSSFGGHMEDFVLMVTPRQRDGGSSQAGASGRGSVVHSEKLLLAMSKLKIREATFLIATYMELYDGPVHMPGTKS